MKKLLILLPVIALIAASCNSKQAAQIKPTTAGTSSSNLESLIDNNSTTKAIPVNSDSQKIVDLQKQLDDLKKENSASAKTIKPKQVATPIPVPFSVPLPTPSPTPAVVQTDFCSNISGAQLDIPSGMIIDNNRNCVVPQVVLPDPLPIPSQIELDHTKRLQEGTALLSQINSYTLGLNSQITSLNSQLQVLQNQIDNVIPSCDGGCTQSQVDALTNNLKAKYNAIVPSYNNLLQIKSRLATIVYEITDWTTSGILPPATDRAYLLQIGISWPVNL